VPCFCLSFCTEKSAVEALENKTNSSSYHKAMHLSHHSASFISVSDIAAYIMGIEGHLIFTGTQDIKERVMGNNTL